MSITKGDIFDLFYQLQTVSRAGGGTQKKKISAVTVSNEKLSTMQKELADDPMLLSYFIKLRDRNKSIAPPPRPSN